MKNLIAITLFGLLLTGCTLLQQPVQNNVDNLNNTNNTNNQTSDNNQEVVVESNKSLDLSSQGLDKLPESVFKKTSLEELNAANNNLTGAVQAEIRHLQQLRILNLSNNNMTGVPAEIGQLSDLEVLDLSNNQLTGLPYELGNLQKLKTFNISGNDYSEYDLEIIKKSLPSSVNLIK